MESHCEEQAVNRSNIDSVSFLQPKRTPEMDDSMLEASVTEKEHDSSFLSNNSLQRMRFLSQSINDMKLLREQQQVRHEEIEKILQDDFLDEHARRLQDARNKIKSLEAKYQLHKRTGLMQQKRRSGDKVDGWHEVLNDEDNSTFDDSNERNTGLLYKPKSFVWESERNLTADSVNNMRKNSEFSNTERYNSTEITEDNLKTEGISPNSSVLPMKWKSLDNLTNMAHDNTIFTNYILLKGDAIPVDGENKRVSKFSRKTGFYSVNDQPKECPLQSKKKKHKMRRFYEKVQSKKKDNASRQITSPSEIRTLGRYIGQHPDIIDAFIIELHKLENKTFGFNIRKGYKDHKNGVFVSKIVDKNAEKFLCGLINVGDEILEIDRTAIREKGFSLVKSQLSDANKLVLTILSHSSRKLEIQ